MPKLLRAALASLVCAAVLAPATHALERVSLRNGFTVECSRHDVFGDRVRLYQDSGSTNYQDFPLFSVTGIETLPDPPVHPISLTPPQRPAPALKLAAAPPHDEIRALLAAAGEQHNIDVELLASIASTESRNNTRAISRAGARGVMQLLPSTARSVGVHDLQRVDQNIAGGASYLDMLLTRYKDNLALALAAYNAGPAAVDRYHGVPPFRETRAYVNRVMSEFYQRKMALLHTQTPPSNQQASR